MTLGSLALANAYIDGSTNSLIVPESRFRDNVKTWSKEFLKTCRVKDKRDLLPRFTEHYAVANKVFESIKKAMYPFSGGDQIEGASTLGSNVEL